jgi:hypothetical protein
MNIIDLCINFVVLYSISIFLWVVISIMAILIYITEDIKQDGIAKTLYFDTLKVANNTFLSLGKMPFFLITILFLILYIIYLIIMFIIPPTGIATLFIPIREMLMSIPPLQELKDKGVFDLYNSTFEFLGFTKTLKSYSYDYFKFSKQNLLEMLRIFNPSLDTNAVEELFESMANKNKPNENIQNDVDVCISNESTYITPDMNFADEIKTGIANVKSAISCNAKSIKPHVLENI